MPPLSSAEIIEHHHERFKSDQTALETYLEDQGNNLNVVPGFRNYIRRLAEVSYESVDFSNTKPTLLDDAVYYAFHELRWSNGKRRATAQEVMPLVKPIFELIQSPDTPSIRAALTSWSVSTCSLAETKFAEVRQITDDIASKKAPSNEQPNVWIYRHEMLPVAIEKRFDSRSALLLTPTTMLGGRIPAGTIATLNRHGSMESAGKHHGQTEFEVLDYTNTPEFGPLRLSPWAYEQPLDRALYGLSKDTGGKTPTIDMCRAAVHALTLADFAVSANQVIELCRVDTSDQAA